MSNISGSMSDLERRIIETGGSPSLTRAESLAEGSLSGGVRTVVGKIEAFQLGDTPSSANRGAFAAVKVDGSVVTWGSAGGGGDSSGVAPQLSGCTDCWEELTQGSQQQQTRKGNGGKNGKGGKDRKGGKGYQSETFPIRFPMRYL